ncbi:hypothetical protein ASPWEDRAFT_29805 [Aspergillus wentii DTO 134E9]|uniref:ChrR-like cupin domain-containing protein n=1 Tax=Aspergillus wentii DTO 134E9 TaxID=1073089 RepID=A0A1L9RCQ1_ASPWE|nr:uncharacterized protein ASPWEDRAFT_29805 [Aspergillus wentii DTO 134E9]KAI9924231.1 hypothetical protein MW887_007181 [Aspergillus wentii]OJJ32647.1 hypothetical protein ASPWEDRAFT_29805 [Aspergillus wentii DTO 134E9]
MAFIQKEFTHPPPHPAIGTLADSPTAKPWYPIGPGIWELLLNGNPNSDNKSVLQWYDPGTKSTQTEPITHTYFEEVCFMQGGLKDLSLGKAWSVGAYAWREPGMVHGPYEASQEGCLQFVKLIPAGEKA